MNFMAKSCKNCLISWKSTKTHGFGRNYATFSNKLPCFGVSMNCWRKVCKKLLNSWKSTKNHRFGQNCASFRTNRHVFAFRWTFQEKVAKNASFREKARKIIDLAKTLQLFEQTTMCLHFDQLFRKKLQKVPHFVKKHEKSSIWPNLWNFSNKLPRLCISINFSGKSCKKCVISWKRTRNHRSCQIFGTFRTNYHVFAFRSTFQKKMQKVPHFDKKNENSSIWPELATFRGNYDVLAFSWTFQKEVAKSASLRGKAREFIDLAKTMTLFVTNYHVLDELFSKRLQKVDQFVKKHEKSSICCRKWESIREKARKIIDLAKSLELLEQTTMSLHFDQLFRKKLQKVPHFVKKDGKSSIWPKLCNFSNKLPCLCISMNFSEKSCKKWLISRRRTRIHRFGQNWQLFEQTTMSWHFHELFRKKLQKVPYFVKSTRIHRFGQNYATFRTNYHVLVFRWTFQQKVAESASIREKARKIIDLAKTMQLSEQTTMSLHFDELFGKKLQKVPHFVKKHEKSSIWPKLCNFPNKLPCLCISMNFSAKSCKKCFSWKRYEKSSIWPKLCNLSKNYHVFAFRWTFQVKVAKSASFREKARKTINLAKTFHFSKKQPCLGIFLNSWARNCKNCLIPWKTTRIHRFGQNYATFSNKLPCFGASVNFSAKVCRKWLNSWKSTKNHRFGQNFATFQTNYHVFAFRWTFQEKVATSASFREKAWETIDLAKTFDFSKKLPFLGIFLNFWARSWKNCLIPWKSTRIHRFGQNYDTFCNKLPCFGVSMNFSAKGCRKWINSWKSTRNHRYGQLFATLNYHVFDFDELFRKKLQKVPHFVKKHEKSSIWPNLWNFSNKLPCLCISINFSGKSCKKCLISWKSTRNHRSIWPTNYHVFAFLFQKKIPHFDKAFRFGQNWTFRGN